VRTFLRHSVYSYSSSECHSDALTMWIRE